MSTKQTVLETPVEGPNMAREIYHLHSLKNTHILHVLLEFATKSKYHFCLEQCAGSLGLIIVMIKTVHIKMPPT